MLQTLRDKTSGWIATVVLGLLIVPFAFVGVQDYFQRSRQQPVAAISAPPGWWASAPSWWPASMLWAREEISQTQFREQFERLRQQQRQQLGEQFDARDFETTDNKRKVLEQLIDERAQALWTRRHGLVVGDSMVRRTIAQIPAFQVDGKFDMQRYRLALAATPPVRTEQQFEQEVRDDLQQRFVPVAVASSNFVTAAEMARLIALLGERRDVTMLDMQAPAQDAGPVSEAEISAWYRKNQGTLRTPETVTLEYVEVDASLLASPAPDEAALRQRYEQEKTRFVADEQRVASHILVRVPAGANAAADKEARDKAARLAVQARAPGADFAALARSSSDDEGSKAAGGDLGPITRGVMPPAFEKALFAMKAGAVSDPVRTEFGWHVIQLRELRAGKQQAFEQVRETLATEATEAARERNFNAVTSRLVDAVLKNPSSLAPAAREAGLQMRTTGPIARGQGAGVIALPAVQRAVFADSAIQQGMVSDPIEVGPDHSVLVRVTAHAPARPLALAEARDRVIAGVRAERLRKAATQRIAGILAHLRAGQPVAAVAASEGLAAPQSLPGVTRGAKVVAPGVADAFFAAQPSGGKVVAGSHLLPDGRAVVFVIDRVIPGSAADLAGAQGEAFKRQLAELGGNVDLQSVVKSIRRGMHVEVHEANL